MSVFLADPDVTIYQGDALDVLRELPDESVHCVATSPPFYGLRDYGVDGQIGLEDTPELWADRLVEVFREARRVLRADGTLWVECGDSYSAGGGFAQGMKHGRANRRTTTIGWTHCDHAAMSEREAGFLPDKSGEVRGTVTPEDSRSETVAAMSERERPSQLGTSTAPAPGESRSETPAYIPGVILDPFAGSGTTGLVARKHGRRAILLELNPDYCQMAARRLQQLSLLTEIT